MGFSNWLGKTAFENIDATTLKVEECGGRPPGGRGGEKVGEARGWLRSSVPKHLDWLHQKLTYSKVDDEGSLGQLYELRARKFKPFIPLHKGS